MAVKRTVAPGTISSKGMVAMVGGDVWMDSICADYLSANSFSHVSLSMRKSLTAATNTHRFAVLTFRCFFCIQYFRCFFCIQYTRKGGWF
jgi:hypothetical protein